ncbi:hypothetical protein DL95DRAFT_29018 [Leptodontidium sp. 2 PMI_412]|nr:hypothetical protein DL95DRAFT_29018 [Leptodontidium sp. 2 PMI_412]
MSGLRFVRRCFASYVKKFTSKGTQSSYSEPQYITSLRPTAPGCTMLCESARNVKTFLTSIFFWALMQLMTSM